MKAAEALAALAVVCALACPASAEQSVLIADEILYSGDGRSFTAKGNVVVSWKDERFRAAEISYDGSKLTAEGPLEFSDAQGTEAVAEFGELSADFRDALLDGVELLLHDRIRFQASELERKNGRYLHLTEATATTCRTCSPEETPFWHFKARSIRHDAVERQIVLRDVNLHLGRYPVFYMPWMRIPDSTVSRASGFLFPSLRYSGGDGLGATLPYFATLGDHADMTIAPTISAKGDNSVDIEFRTRFRGGGVDLGGSLTSDSDHVPRRRWQAWALGDWESSGGLGVRASGERVSDADYLADADISGKPRIENSVRIDLRHPYSFLGAGVHEFEFLDGIAPEPGTPLLIQEATWTQRFPHAALGGRLQLDFGVSSFRRFGPDDHPGRNVLRSHARLDWHHAWEFESGVRMSASGELLGRAYADANGGTADSASATPTISTSLAWPWIRNLNGESEILQPVAAMAWSPVKQAGHANLDSAIVGIDDTNLLGPGRVPGLDGTEQGLRTGLGVMYSRVAPAGLSGSAFVGRTFTSASAAHRPDAPSLSGRHSDWVAAFDLDLPGPFELKQKLSTDSGFAPTVSDTIVEFETPDFGLLFQRSWVRKDRSIGTAAGTDYWLAQGSYPVSRNWDGVVGIRYDANKHGPRRMDVGFIYKQQCANVELRLSHRLPSANVGRPKTALNVSLTLAGLGDAAAGAADSCG